MNQDHLLNIHSLPRFPDRDEPGAQMIREGTTENEAARLDADHFGNPLIAITIDEFVHNVSEGLGVLQQRCDVIKQNAGLWKVRHLTDIRFVIHSLPPFLEEVVLFHGILLYHPPKLHQRGGFDLPDALTRQAELLAYLL